MSGLDDGADLTTSNFSLLDAMRDSVFLSNENDESMKSSFKFETQSSNSSEKTDQFRVYDVIIIGAGLSGLTAAYYLKKQYKDINILILEAKDRIGGRTFTTDIKCSNNGTTKKWDLGGQWVTDTQTYVTALLKELNIETYKQYDKGIKVLEVDGKTLKYDSTIPNISIPSLIDLQLMMMKVNRNCKNISTLDPFVNLQKAEDLDKLNSQEYVFKNSYSKIAQAIVKVAYRNLYGLEMSELNALFTMLYTKSGGGTIESLALSDEGCGQEKRVKGGTQQISERLLQLVLNGDREKAKILLNRPVVEINQQQSDRVHVTVLNDVTREREIYSATKIISSIPLNQYTKVNFTPLLPLYKKNVFESCKVGNYMKFIVTYEKSFWRLNGFSGEVVCDGSIILDKFEDQIFDKPRIGPISVVYDATTDDGAAALVGFCVADSLVQWSDLDLTVRRREIIRGLVRFFGVEAENYIEYQEKRWNLEPYNGGCPTCNVVSSGVLKDYVRATREPFLNIHFAGTESSTQWQGYMDGAIESGIRAANEVLYALHEKDNSLDIKFDYSQTYYHQREAINKLKKKDLEISKYKSNFYKVLFKYIIPVGIPIYIILKLKPWLTKS